MRVLILGSRGLVGRALVNRLIASGHDVVEWDVKISAEHDLASDATLPLLRKAIESCEFTFFLAYDVGGSKYLATPTLDFINNNSKIMANTFTLLKSKRFVFASSTMSNMNVAYGALKMVGEHYTTVLGGVVARFWNIYGLQDIGDRSYVLNDFVHSFLTTNRVEMLSNGRERRQFLHTEDCAKCLETIMQNYDRMKTVVDVSSFEWTTIHDAAKLICDDVVLGETAGDSHSFNEEPDDFILRFWKPTIMLKDGVEALIQETREYMKMKTMKKVPERFSRALIKQHPVQTKAPARIDLAGAWTDVPSVAKKIGGAVVSFAVNLCSHAECWQNAEGELHGSYRSMTPLGSGLGTTGAVNVALMAAIAGPKFSKEEIAERAFQFETIAGNLGGRQDQYMAALGGFRHLIFNHDTVEHERVHVSAEFREWLHRSLVLFDSQIPHTSGDLHHETWEKYEAGDVDVARGMSELKDAAHLMLTSLTRGDKQAMFDALNLVCSGVDNIDTRIHAPFKHVMEQLVLDGSVAAWKALGAGAGGCVIALVNDGRATEVDARCRTEGWKRIDWDFDEDGLVYCE